MRTTSHTSLITVFLFSFTLFISTLAQAQIPIQGFPDDDADSGRMINITRGNSTLGDTDDEVLNVSIRIPASEANVTVEIFDGNSTSIYGDTTQGFWDQVQPETATPDDVVFELYRDPNLVGNTDPANLLFSQLGSAMVDNDWHMFVNQPNDPGAQAPPAAPGDLPNDYGYHLVARWVTETADDITNAFKVRANGLPFLLAGSTIGFQGYTSAPGILDDVYPTTINYDGSFNYAAELNSGLNCYIDVYDGDLDRADDTDDPNTDNLGVTNGGFYPFSFSPSANDEAGTPGAPPDDFTAPNPNSQNFLRISPSVTYILSGPTGLASPTTYSVANDNPSGNTEIELFRVASSAPGCPDPGTNGAPNPNYDPPAIDLNGDPSDGNEYDPPMAAPDRVVPGLADGFHFLTVVGLDPLNNAFINVSADVVPIGALADYGDAPDDYGTDKVNDSGEGVGPSHIVVGDLLIGGLIDQELDGAASGNADGDNNLGLNDEEGVTFTTPLTTDLVGQSYFVDVDVINGILDTDLTFIDATLVGWIDFNRNGTFEELEAVSAIVTSTGVTQTISLEFTVPPDVQAGETFARFRLTTDPSIDETTPGGAAYDGEVEDYPITIEMEPPTGGGQGCTPGYWKQKHHFDSWVFYMPGDSYEAVFGITGYDKTLLKALKTGGGGQKALGRHSVAALLNTANSEVNYLYTESEVIQIVQQAYAVGTKSAFNQAKNLLEEQNEMGCPLN